MKRVLIVEDQDPFITQALLEAYGGIKTIVSKRGDEAIELFSAGSFDSVVLDLRLPILDGFVVLQAIRKIEPDIPVIVLSSYGDKKTRERAAQLGASAFYNKPPDYLRVYNRLTQLMAAYITQKQLKEHQTIKMDGKQLEIMAKHRRLQTLKLQAARMGVQTPVHILIEIEDLEKELNEIT